MIIVSNLRAIHESLRVASRGDDPGAVMIQ
jgi:hypothetical protein